MDDDDLIAAVTTGDDLSLRELFNRHSPWVAGRLRRTMPVDAVEDVLQETFIAVWRGARSYEGQGEVGAWIWGIARRQAAMWSRKHGRPEAIPEERVTEDPALSAGRRVDLERALSLIGPEGHEQRELIRLVFVEDRSLSDVAGLLGLPEGTVKSRLYKARQVLQAILRKGGYDAASS